MDWSVRRIDRIRALNNATRYLEIGVERGTTFLNVPIPIKDGVDPKFMFDPAAVVTSHIRLFSQTSDAFWISGRAQVYDVMMIDGLHTFEQTFRDMLCSMRYSHSKTVWLIDDTLPSDVFSAIPDQNRSYRERQKMNIAGAPWHGDVFKIVPAIRDFIPTLDYATIVNSGNPQTLLWFGSKQEFKPVVNNLELVSRMSYFDIEPNLGLYNLATEDQAFSRLAAAFSEVEPHPERP